MVKEDEFPLLRDVWPELYDELVATLAATGEDGVSKKLGKARFRGALVSETEERALGEGPDDGDCWFWLSQPCSNEDRRLVEAGHGWCSLEVAPDDTPLFADIRARPDLRPTFERLRDQFGVAHDPR